jgi:hypothetical protein
MLTVVGEGYERRMGIVEIGDGSRCGNAVDGKKLNARQPDWVEQPTAGRVSLVADAAEAAGKANPRGWVRNLSRGDVLSFWARS